MQSLTKAILNKQLTSIVVYEFLNLFNLFERAIRVEFEKSLTKISPEIKQELYFIYGSKLGTYIEYDPLVSKITSMNYKSNEKFSEVSINQILKFDRNRKIIDKFQDKVQSLQRKTDVYDFHDSAIKLLNMRNILSHELNDCKFKNKDIIEVLSLEKIESNNIESLQNFDLNLMDDATKQIFSNFVYMYKMIEMLSFVDAIE